MVRLVLLTFGLSAVLFLFLLTGTALPRALLPWLRSTAAPQLQQLAAQLSARELRRAYAAEARGEAAYGNSTLEVTGVCLGVVRTADGSYFVKLGDEGGRVCVVGRLPAWMGPDAAAAAAGSTVVVRGRCVGRKPPREVGSPAAVCLEECTLVRGPET